MDRVYSFTNENISSYQSLYDFKNAKVLSVLGSGDQYFSSILFGAKDVEVFDINPLTWHHFLLKFYGIMVLDYDEFYNYFVEKKLKDIKTFNKIKPYLPPYTRDRILEFYNCHAISCFTFQTGIASIQYNDGTIIPYFDKENYLKLQLLLRERCLPKFYNNDLLKLENDVSNNSYDIMLTSNIIDWLDMPIGDYKELLKRFKFCVAQANYEWQLNSLSRIEYEYFGFEIKNVPPSRVLQKTPDHVISLKSK